MQKRTRVVHLVATDEFTLCGRWAGRRTSFRESGAPASCAHCKQVQAKRRRERQARVEDQFAAVRSRFAEGRAA